MLEMVAPRITPDDGVGRFISSLLFFNIHCRLETDMNGIGRKAQLVQLRVGKCVFVE